MFLKQRAEKGDTQQYNSAVFDNSTLKVIMFASFIIVLGVLLMGSVSYYITKNAVINKLKSRDLSYIAQSISSKIDGRIERALETSLILARDPYISKWVEEGEKDKALETLALKKITDIAQNYDYNNSFIVSTVTNHYWAEGGKLIDTMSKDDPDDRWFFDAISSKEPISIVIDYNNERGDTFVFVNALMGNISKPSAITGIGLNLKDIAKEFEGYKFGESSNMWLIDSKGSIYISEDLDQIEKNIADLLPEEISSEIIKKTNNDMGKNSNVLEYKNGNGQLFDLIYQPIKSTNWKLIFQIPRKESISIIDSIRINTVTASFISILLIVFIFYLISSKIANPYKRALVLSRELEKMVDERTSELNEKNLKIMDSIEYAKMIQQSILPQEKDLKSIFKDYFIIWKPKDVVGGDFYWVKKFDNGSFILAVGDCTGHGVPGALMTMTVNSILNHMVDYKNLDSPSYILSALNLLVKKTLQNRSDKFADDGLDIGIVSVLGDGRLVFAGARISLYIAGKNGLTVIKGENKSIGYKRTCDNLEFTDRYVDISDNNVIYLTTDGYPDQNGGDKNYSMGKRAFEKIIDAIYMLPLTKQKDIFEEELKKYMGCEVQRDDITVIGFK